MERDVSYPILLVSTRKKVNKADKILAIHLLNVQVTTRLSTSCVANGRLNLNINGKDVQRKNVVKNVDKSSLWAR